MAKRRQKSSSKKAEATEETLVVGFLGTGKISKKGATALLGDWVEARDETVQFAVPLNEDHWTQSMATVATFAEENDIEIIAVHDGEEDNDPEDLLEGKFSAVKSKNVPERVIKESDLIVFLWEDTEQMEELLDIANEKDLDCYDLGDGLQRLELEEVEDESDDDDPDDGDEEEETEEEEFPEVDLATFDIDSLDTKDDRERIMAIGEDLGVETYKGMRVGTMVKEIKKAQKVLQAQQADDGDEGDEPEEKPAKAAKPSKKAAKKAEPAEEPEDDGAEVLDAEVLSSSRHAAYPANIVVNISLNGEDLTDETLNALREFLASV